MGWKIKSGRSVKRFKSMENSKTLQGEKKALRIVEAVLDKQAKNPVVLDVRGISTLCDYFVVCAGETGRQVQAIAEGIKRADGIDVGHVEADEDGNWIMVDCSDVIVHAFTEGTRVRYDLENLWKKAKQIYPTGAKNKPAAVKTGAKKTAVKNKKKPAVKKITKQKSVKKSTKKPAKKKTLPKSNKKTVAKVVVRKKRNNK